MDQPIYIHFAKAEGPLPLGASHWWGYPDMPEDYEIPVVKEGDSVYGLTLLCQINLADLPPCALPRTGMLLFFADIAYYGGYWDEPAISGYMSDNKSVRVLYVPEYRMADLVNRAEEYADEEAKPIPLRFNHTPASGDEPDLQLLGTTDHLEWETWPEPCEDWELLLMMDSMDGDDYNYNFMDWGVLCLLISPKDLAKHDFADVRAIVLST